MTPQNPNYSTKKLTSSSQKKINNSAKIGKFESGSSTENFANIYQNNLAPRTTTSVLLEEIDDEKLEEIVREGEEIDESIERLEESIKRLRGGEPFEEIEEEEEDEDKIFKKKVPKLNFKRLKSQGKKKKKKKVNTVSSNFYSHHFPLSKFK